MTPMTLSNTAIRELPVHDARFLSVSFMPGVSSLEVRFAIEINSDEDISALQRYGIRQRKLQFVFSECWTANCEIVGTISTSETIDDWVVGLDGALIQLLRAKGFANNSRVSEHSIKTSNGSRIRIVAEQVALAEPSADLRGSS